MSVDYNFWKQSRPLEQSSEEIYSKLCREEVVDGLENLPVDVILQRIQEAFPGFNPKEDFPEIEFDGGLIEVGWTTQYFRFDRRGSVDAEHLNVLVDILAAYDCPMYDPQIDKRYDAKNGIALGDKYRFEELAIDEDEFIDGLKALGLNTDALKAKQQKTGCGTAIIIFAFTLLAALFTAST